MIATQKAYWMLAVFAFATGQLPAQPADPLPALNVSKDKMSFDPKTVAVGATGGVHTGCIGAAIKIIRRTNEHCEFTYRTDGCGGVFADYVCRVPLTSDALTIESINGGIKTSFDFDKFAKFVRSDGPIVQIAVGDTGESVMYHRSEVRSEMKPKTGDRVKFRFQVFGHCDFIDLAEDTKQNQTIEFVVGSNDALPWLATAMEHMTVGDRRRIELPRKIAGPVTDWLPTSEKTDRFFIEASLVNCISPRRN